MVKQVPYFEDSSGKAHRTEHEAWKADVALWFVETGAVNEASAKQLVEHICSGGQQRANDLANMIKVFAGTMPHVVETVISRNEFLPVQEAPQ